MSTAPTEALRIARAWLVENHDQIASGRAWERYVADLATIDAALAAEALPPAVEALPALTEDEARELFNEWYDRQAMPQLLARMDPQQAAYNAFEFGRSLALRPPQRLETGETEL